MPVNKKEFADRMAAKGGIKKKDAMKGLDLFIETLMDCMSENEKVKLLNFGSFQMRTVKERIGRNPQTGQECIIPEHEKVKFVASEGFADRINERRNE
jgi:nucleoid DNA-binding protein